MNTDTTASIRFAWSDDDEIPASAPLADPPTYAEVMAAVTAALFGDWDEPTLH